MDSFLNPNEIINRLNLRSDMVGVDFGCGSGGWTIPLAKKLKDGTVFAVDLLTEPLSALTSRAQAERVSNIKTIRADVEGSVVQISQESVDLVLLTNLLFQTANKKTVISEAKRILKTGGQILVVDWKAGAPSGPKGKEVSVSEMKDLASQLGLKFDQEFDAGSWHFALVLVK